MSDSVQTRRAYRLVADQVLALIAAEGLRPGDRLPSERDLADRLAVSRPALREALIALEVEGRVAIRMGSGIYVAPPRGPGVPLTDDEGPFEILRARAIVESALAEEAARRITPAIIARLDSNLDEMERVLTDRPRAIAVDGAFHLIVAETVANTLLTSFTAAIFAKRLSPLFAGLATHFEGVATWRQALDEHRRVRDALAARDPAAAREAMRHHLDQSQRRFSASFSASAPAQAPPPDRDPHPVRDTG
ncbi:FadR/GntR family transcriptional regulator [Paracoccus endophyticus]|uniref:FadR/GntR family transcriptional regulator n=1 Tax=Paracoccus endophyticus TaxID=2233774 RepID=UPI000DDAEE67|nr:FCD domain-containing protein [Paracoccus endophyticus]